MSSSRAWARLRNITSTDKIAAMITFDEAVPMIIDVGQRMAARGSAPATSGNYSLRLHDGTLAVTVSGRDKGRLTAADVMQVDAAGTPLENKIASAETLLHADIYRRAPHAGSVLHSHALVNVRLGRARRGETQVVLSGYEMLKALPGVSTHDTSVRIAIVENSQDMMQIIASLDAALQPTDSAYLIRDHGLYAWGRNVAEALRVIEAVEYMFACAL